LRGFDAVDLTGRVIARQVPQKGLTFYPLQTPISVVLQ